MCLGWLAEKSWGGREYPHYTFKLWGQRKQAQSAREMAERLFFRPETETSTPDVGSGLPWLAAQLAQRYEGGGPGLQELLQLLHDQGTTCVEAYWVGYSAGKPYPNYVFAVEGHQGHVRAVDKVAQRLGLKPRTAPVAQGLPWLAEQLHWRYLVPVSGPQAVHELLRARGLACMSATLKDYQRQMLPKYSFAAQGQAEAFTERR